MDIVGLSVIVNGQQHIIFSERSYRERMYNIAYKVLFSLDPDKVKNAEILYSPEYAEAIEYPQKCFKAVLDSRIKELTIESYVVDRARSRDISIDELEEAIDYLIEYNKNRMANGDATEFSTGKGSKESSLTNYILHLYSRVADYNRSFPVNVWHNRLSHAFFDANDQIQLFNLDNYRKKYLLHNLLSEKRMHILYTFKRLIQKDKILRDQDPRCILHNLTYHPGFEHRHNIRKLKMSLALISSIGLIGLAFYKGYGVAPGRIPKINKPVVVTT